MVEQALHISCMHSTAALTELTSYDAAEAQTQSRVSCQKLTLGLHTPNIFLAISADNLGQDKQSWPNHGF